MDPTMVIKVKYGETLRRFHAHILTYKYGLDIDGLGKKICSLFNLPSDSDLKMTYIDKDGDVVTLVDDDDLYDILRQKMKFLRIDVELRDKMNKNPGLDSQAGELDSIRGTPFLASTVENGEEGSTREANLLDKLPENCQRFPATPAAGTSIGSHPVAWDKKLPAVSFGAPQLFENGSDPRIMEIRLREMEEKRLRRDNKIRDLWTNCSVTSFDENNWDAVRHDLEELGFGDIPMVERLLKKNDGNIRRTFLGLLAGERA